MPANVTQMPGSRLAKSSERSTPDAQASGPARPLERGRAIGRRRRPRRCRRGARRASSDALADESSPDDDAGVVGAGRAVPGSTAWRPTGSSSRAGRPARSLGALVAAGGVVAVGLSPSSSNRPLAMSTQTPAVSSRMPAAISATPGRRRRRRRRRGGLRSISPIGSMSGGRRLRTAGPHAWRAAARPARGTPSPPRRAPRAPDRAARSARDRAARRDPRARPRRRRGHEIGVVDVDGLREGGVEGLCRGGSGSSPAARIGVVVGLLGAVVRRPARGS